MNNRVNKLSYFISLALSVQHKGVFHSAAGDVACLKTSFLYSPWNHQFNSEDWHIYKILNWATNSLVSNNMHTIISSFRLAGWEHVNLSQRCKNVKLRDVQRFEIEKAFLENAFRTHWERNIIQMLEDHMSSRLSYIMLKKSGIMLSGVTPENGPLCSKLCCPPCKEKRLD